MSDSWDNYFDDPAVKKWARHIIDDTVPKMRNSAIVVQMVPDGTGDVKFWVELGASIMMDKPIVAVVFGDAKVPEKLKLIADDIVRLPEGANPAGADKLAAALSKLAMRKDLYD
jgi:hypothetical protein